MSSGQARAYDDAEEYLELCKLHGVEPQYHPGGIYPYNINTTHYYKLLYEMVPVKDKGNDKG